MSLQIQSATPMEFFKEQVERALERQNVESSADTACYLTQLLDDFVRPRRVFRRAGADPEQPLAEIFCAAITSSGHRRFELLKLTGDSALFASGFLSESLVKKPVGADYFVQLGGQAYGVIRSEHRKLGDLFGELAEKFGLFADVLAEVSEVCSLTDDRNLIRLYERWLHTHSQRSAEQLREKGILVVPASDAVH
jgi:hypothetical protein